ncbi:Uma2 family endonuclease [Paludisphaera mucosa]|uniref:Uma2 family endonuclease n=1 Tax=Paludisphaera mucosa TaxID=3030827 RepID=A0ABT6FDY2_9BACT|nr:Uma2 family endonuclease [Paludisphaera mucosa]MDG3005759.1 Uma2 family endonuclease [Paludisphaera mucosa]
MASVTRTSATIDDLRREKGKAELIAGRIVQLMPTGRKPSRVAFRIARGLDDFAQAAGQGEAFADNTGYAVPELGSGRRSFAPAASYHQGPLVGDDMRFVDGPPTFAVEVRSENDYGEAAEEAMAAKRADYLEAGTLVVWDVDLLAAGVRKHRSDSPDQPEVFSAGQEADAEPAVPGWRMAVDRIFA